MSKNNILESYTTPELIDYIRKNYHEPIKSILPEIRELFDQLSEWCWKNNDLLLLKTLFMQFNIEILKSIKNKEHSLFALLWDVAEWKECDKRLIEKSLKIRKRENDEFISYFEGGFRIMWKLCQDNDIKDHIPKVFSDLKKLSEDLYKLVQECINTEENVLLPKVKEECS